MRDLRSSKDAWQKEIDGREPTQGNPRKTKASLPSHQARDLAHVTSQVRAVMIDATCRLLSYFHSAEATRIGRGRQTRATFSLDACDSSGLWGTYLIKHRGKVGGKGREPPGSFGHRTPNDHSSEDWVPSDDPSPRSWNQPGSRL